MKLGLITFISILCFSLPSAADSRGFLNFLTPKSQCAESLKTSETKASEGAQKAAKDFEEDVLDLMAEVESFKRYVTQLKPGKMVSQEKIKYIFNLHAKKVSDYFVGEAESVEHDYKGTKVSFPRTAKKDVELLYTDTLELVSHSKNLLLKQSKERELSVAEEFLLKAFTAYDAFLRSKETWFYNKISLLKYSSSQESSLILGALAERMFIDFLAENSTQLSEGEYLNSPKPKKKKKPFIFTAKFWQKRVANKYGGGLIFFIPMAFLIWPEESWLVTVDVFTRYFGWLAPLFGG